jgi:hypothetical protein
MSIANCSAKSAMLRYRASVILVSPDECERNVSLYENISAAPTVVPSSFQSKRAAFMDALAASRLASATE